MRRELVWGLAALIAFIVGVTCARPYANLMAPYYSAVARLFALGHPWTTGRVEVKPNNAGPGYILTSTNEVRRLAGDPMPAARAVTRIQVAESIEAPLVFWTLLLVWPSASQPASASRRFVAALRPRLLRFGVGVPIFLALEALTTATQFIYALPAVSAMLAGEAEPHTLLDHWSEFLEGGGRFAVEIFAALLALAVTAKFASRGSAPSVHASDAPA
jgi:hypothetical protein